jgi:hypothetical protein
VATGRGVGVLPCSSLRCGKRNPAPTAASDIAAITWKTFFRPVSRSPERHREQRRIEPATVLRTEQLMDEGGGRVDPHARREQRAERTHRDRAADQRTERPAASIAHRTPRALLRVSSASAAALLPSTIPAPAVTTKRSSLQTAVRIAMAKSRSPDCDT